MNFPRLAIALISVRNNVAKKSRDRFGDDDAAAEAALVYCWLCGRLMGDMVEWHHPVPKSRGGKVKEPIHPICHRAIHANFTNSDLEKRYATAQALLAHEEIGRFVRWVATKPPNFYAPTKIKDR